VFHSFIVQSFQSLRFSESSQSLTLRVSKLIQTKETFASFIRNSTLTYKRSSTTSASVQRLLFRISDSQSFRVSESFREFQRVSESFRVSEFQILESFIISKFQSQSSISEFRFNLMTAVTNLNTRNTA
jgi:hypothetical protein